MNRHHYTRELSHDHAGLWKDSKPLIQALDVELTERCNLNCIHCCVNRPPNDRDAKQEELSLEEWKRTFEEAASLGCLSLRITGGEPLLKKEFVELYLFARRLGLTVTLFTNATLLTPDLAKLFSTIPPREKVEITLYGMTTAAYENVTQIPGSFEAANRGIDLLREYSVPFAVKYALLPPNMDELDSFLSFASTITQQQRSPSCTLFLDLRHRRDSAEKNRRIARLRLPPDEALRIVTREPGRFLQEMKDFCSRFMSIGGDRLFLCSAGLRTGCLDSYGRLQPCLSLRHPSTTYDVIHGSLESAFREFFPCIRETKASNLDYLSRCGHCFIKGFCDQCPGKSWAEHGTLDTPVDYFCGIAHAQARFLGLIKANEMAWEVTDWRERLELFIGSESNGDLSVIAESCPSSCNG